MLYEISEKAIQLENQGKKMIKFNLGDPDMPTPPQIIEAAYEAMKQGKTKYSSAAGEKKLREELASIHNVSADNVVITTGSKWAIFSLMFLLLKRGENVVVPSPHWTSYELAARRVGAELRFLRRDLESDWKIDVEKLGKLIDEKTRLIILNSPDNPTSKVIDEKTFSEIVQIAKSKGVTVLSDEVYSDISFVKAKSILDFGKDQILVNGFSKIFAMTGWRIGYAIVEKELAQKMIKLNQITTTCVPAFIQYGALKGLESRKKIADEIRAQFRLRADAAINILSKTKLKFSRPDAPFYLFPKCDNLDSERFALNLLDRGVAVAPGTAFGDYREYFRIALTVGEEKIREGLEKLCEALP
ncbi:MAG: aminotransferase class I/II-fold pyridoxal phosphate-dependent enzyme [Candidatus Bathyarchaeota archaeon]|nr:aminotransferase class I/II-fold pyridoxal phosphate-dependent enzyme [Candidatus Bathyarchaeota archaeon]